MEEDNPLGLGYTPTVSDAIEGTVNYLGGVARFYQKTVPQFFTGVRRAIKEESEAPSPITETLNPIQAAGELTTAYSQAESTALEQVASGAESLGLPEPVAGAAALAVSPFLPGLAEMSLVTKGGAATLMGLTVTDPRFIAKGITEGVAEQPQFAAALTRRDDALTKVRANIARREAQGKPATKYKKELAGKGSTLDYDPDDPIVFEKARYRVYDPLDPERTAHQHHLFAKAQSYPFVEKMEELISLGKADRDDLVNMFAFADMLDVTMGNTRKNMLDAPGRAHIDAAPGSTQFDKSRNIHTLLKEFDLEIPGNQVRKIVADADNATELMKRFNDYILESVKPQKVVAQRIVEDFLERHKRSLPKDQLPMFNDLVSKLGGRIKR